MQSSIMLFVEGSALWCQAKISLREHVRDNDVDAAIAILVRSFINSQKKSVRASLERGFRKYIACSCDFFALLLHALRSLVREAQAYDALRLNPRGLASAEKSPLLEVLVDDFEAKVCEFDGIGELEEQLNAGSALGCHCLRPVSLFL